MAREVLADSPAASATRRATVGMPADGNVNETVVPVASAVPSPLKSQLAVSASPSGSVDVEVNVTGAPTWPGRW